MEPKSAGTILHLDAAGALSHLVETPFVLEVDLQKLLAEHPELLPGDQIDPEEPRRWLLIDREVEVPGDSTSWALDHLFVDQDAVPTLVEVKRGSNPELRRKIIGQMLDYAANAPLNWSAASVRTLLDSRLAKVDQTSDALIETTFEVPPQEFWDRVEANLQQRRLRLLFVTDRIVPELRRVVEFLNQAMEGVDVLAVELRQFSGNGHRTIVPTVFGNTLATDQKRAGVARKRTTPWTKEEFFTELEKKHGAELSATAKVLFDWALDRKAGIWWGKGAASGSFAPVFELGGSRLYPFLVWTYGRVELQFQYLLQHPPFDRFEERDAIRRQLRQFLDLEISDQQLSTRPAFDLMRLANEETRGRFLALVAEIVQRAREENPR